MKCPRSKYHIVYVIQGNMTLKEHILSVVTQVSGLIVLMRYYGENSPTTRLKQQWSTPSMRKWLVSKKKENKKKICL